MNHFFLPKRRVYSFEAGKGEQYAGCVSSNLPSCRKKIVIAIFLCQQMSLKVDLLSDEKSFFRLIIFSNRLTGYNSSEIIKKSTVAFIGRIKCTTVCFRDLAKLNLLMVVRF